MDLAITLLSAINVVSCNFLHLITWRLRQTGGGGVKLHKEEEIFTLIKISGVIFDKWSDIC